MRCFCEIIITSSLEVKMLIKSARERLLGFQGSVGRKKPERVLGVAWHTGPLKTKGSFTTETGAAEKQNNSSW